MLYRASDFARDSGDQLVALICDFARHVQDPAFPCMFAGRAMGRDQLLFGLSDEYGVVDLMRDAAEAIKAVPDQVVVLFVDSPRIGTLESEKELAGDLLRRLHNADRVPWHPDAPTDPGDPRWVFWFEGIDFFVNFSTPSHRRRSRNLGSALAMVVQARSSFDDFAEPENRIRALIRARVRSYDGMLVHPAVGTYGDPTSREATQYFLGDSNDINIDLLTREDFVQPGQDEGDTAR